MRWKRGINLMIMQTNTLERNEISVVTVAVYGAGILLLGVFLARWIWILFAPPTAMLSVPTERSSITESSRLFGVATATTSVVEGSTLPEVQLVGVFATSPGKPGFAILKLDNKRQLGVAVGGEVAPGTTLRAVYTDYVVLERAGIQHKVQLDAKHIGEKHINLPPIQGVPSNPTAFRAAQKARDHLQAPRSGNIDAQSNRGASQTMRESRRDSMNKASGDKTPGDKASGMRNSDKNNAGQNKN